MLEEHVKKWKQYGLYLWQCLQPYARRYALVGWCALAGMVAGGVMALSLPPVYETRIFTAPESTVSRETGEDDETGLGTALGGARTQDAIIPSLYPLVISSTVFLTELFEMPVQPSFCPPDSTMTLREYLLEHQRRPWWSFVRTGFSKVVGMLSAPLREGEDNVLEDDAAWGLSAAGSGKGVVRLSRTDAAVAGAIRGLVQLDVDKKRRTVAIVVRTQDPRVSSTLADSIRSRIQAYVTDYRTQKEKQQLVFAERLHRQAREAYYAAQERYAHFADRNRQLVGKQHQKELVNLQIKKELAYKEYVSTALQEQRAKMQVYRKRPVFAVIEPAITPLHPCSPSLPKAVLAGCTLFGAAGYGWLWLRKKLIGQ